MIGLSLVFLLSVDSRTQKSLNSCLKQILWDQLILSNFSTPLLISRASAFFLLNLRQKKTEVHLAFLMRKALFFLLVDSFLYLFSPCSLTFLFFGSKRGSWEDDVSDPLRLERRTFSLIRSGTQSIPYEPPDESEIHIHLQGAKNYRSSLNKDLSLIRSGTKEIHMNLRTSQKSIFTWINEQGLRQECNSFQRRGSKNDLRTQLL